MQEKEEGEVGFVVEEELLEWQGGTVLNGVGEGTENR